VKDSRQDNAASVVIQVIPEVDYYTVTPCWLLKLRLFLAGGGSTHMVVDVMEFFSAED
jgi:hypothetical protein